VVQHELVAVGVGEDRHVADAGVERVAEEGHALGLQLRARRVDVLHAQRQRVAGLSDELHPDLLRLPDAKTSGARPLLVRRVLVGAHAKDVAVEAACAVGVLRRDADEVELLDECHVVSLSIGPGAARARLTRDVWLGLVSRAYRD
jgi:hypothetical protein